MRGWSGTPIPRLYGVSGERFYITTPIYYVNADPHVGHAYTTIMADILARHHRQRGEDVFFLTGTDEHGAKIARSAAEAGRSPQEHADLLAGRFRDLGALLEASNDFFVRTTDPAHEQRVQAILERLRASGDLYKGSYGGWYCTACEAVLPGGRPAGGSALPGARDARGVARGGELVLPALGLPRPAAGALRRRIRSSSARPTGPTRPAG